MEIVRASLGRVAGVIAFFVSVAAHLGITRRAQWGTSLVTGLGVGAIVSAVEAFQYRQATPKWVRELERASSHGGAAENLGPPPPPWPLLRDLVRVVPIAQGRALDGITVTLLSLESYADGFLVAGRATHDATAGPAGTHSFPRLVFGATDDSGRRYDAWPRESGGGDGEWRFLHSFGPALDPTATELRLEIAEVQWQRFDREGPTEVRAERGPWAFTVSL